MSKIQVFTDGSCIRNPGPGGFAICILIGKEKYIKTGAETFTTNNRMEIKGVLLALNSTRDYKDVDIFTDSSYVVNGYNKWMKSWEKNNWKTSQGKHVLNEDLWRELLLFSKSLSSHKIHWIKGHNNNCYNEEVDKEARQAAYKVSQKIVPESFFSR